jgi:FkbM family methyltransferase
MDLYSSKILKEVETTYAIPFLNYPFKLGRAKKGVAVDLGSNIGGFSIVFSNNFREVICVEPSSLANRIAYRNYLEAGIIPPYTYTAAISHTDNLRIDLHRVYVDDEYESKDFTTTTWDEEEITNSGFKGVKRGIEEVVTSISLPSIFAQIKEPITFLKCDIEGGEFDAFMNQDLNRIHFLVMELHYSALGKARTNELIFHLEKFFDYYHPSDELKFHDWPPPPILRMINKTDLNRTTRILGRYISPRFTFFSIKVLNSLRKKF